MILIGIVFVTLGMIGLQTTVSTVAVGLQVMFVAYFLRHMVFAVSAMSASAERTVDSHIDHYEAGVGTLPSVTVMVACKDEVLVVDHLVMALDELDYPADLLEKIIVDDGSEDGTAEALDYWAAWTPDLVVLHRPSGLGGGKSAALNTALKHARGDIIIVFDTDHTPRSDVVVRHVRHYTDSRVAAVQGRCVVRNAGDSVIARLVAIDYSAGYLVNEFGRDDVFQLPAYGGANCSVRASTLRAVGGWNPNTVTEDTDLTLRLVLIGEIIKFDVTAIDEEEAVISLRRFWRQRYRWARGHQQAARDYRYAIWRCPELSLMERIESMMFLHAFHIPIATMVTTILAGLWMTGIATPIDPLATFVLWTLLFLGPLLELGAGLVLGGHDRRDARAMAFFIPLYFVSGALCTMAWLDAVINRHYDWVRTARRHSPESEVVA
ncbi:MAG: glycosyltransferase [Actinomycetia bacterium]|nr:glycosyltransferase [Actinomycetes bacterium]